MATILPFVIPRRARDVARGPKGDAAIIIFPGVRYEYPADEGACGALKAATASPRKPKSKRN